MISFLLYCCDSRWDPLLTTLLLTAHCADCAVVIKNSLPVHPRNCEASHRKQRVEKSLICEDPCEWITLELCLQGPEFDWEEVKPGLTWCTSFNRVIPCFSACCGNDRWFTLSGWSWALHRWRMPGVQLCFIISIYSLVRHEPSPFAQWF